MINSITIIIPTFNRPEILEQTISLLLANLTFNGDFAFLIGNDGDEIKLSESLTKYNPITILPGPKKGLGANLNMLLHASKTDIVLQMDDDHILQERLDINQFVKDLRNQKNNIDWIRLFIGTEKDLNNDDPFYKFVAKMNGRYWIPSVTENSELYIASCRAHLKLKSFHDYYGYYKEGLRLGETEVNFCHRYIDVRRDVLTKFNNGERVHYPPTIAIPVAAPSFNTWDHVGDSYQKQGY